MTDTHDALKKKNVWAALVVMPVSLAIPVVYTVCSVYGDSLAMHTALAEHIYVHAMM